MDITRENEDRRSGVCTLGDDPASYQLPDESGFTVAIAVDGNFVVETFQVDWIAYWKDRFDGVRKHLFPEF